MSGGGGREALGSGLNEGCERPRRAAGGLGARLAEGSDTRRHSEMGIVPCASFVRRSGGESRARTAQPAGVSRGMVAGVSRAVCVK